MLFVWVSIALLAIFIRKVKCASFHGGTYLALAGKDSVALICDSRFSSIRTGSMMLGSCPRLCYRIGSKCIVGCFGLDSDVYHLIDLLRMKLIDHADDDLQPESISRVVSDLLYNNDFLFSPIIVGLTDHCLPYICSMDGLGAQTVSDKFAVTGTASEGLYALCESLYLPNLESHELLILAEKCFYLGLQRDVLSGGDFQIITITRGNIFVKDIVKSDV